MDLVVFFCYCLFGCFLLLFFLTMGGLVLYQLVHHGWCPNLLLSVTQTTNTIFLLMMFCPLNLSFTLSSEYFQNANLQMQIWSRHCSPSPPAVVFQGMMVCLCIWSMWQQGAIPLLQPEHNSEFICYIGLLHKLFHKENVLLKVFKTILQSKCKLPNTVYQVFHNLATVWVSSSFIFYIKHFPNIFPIL